MRKLYLFFITVLLTTAVSAQPASYKSFMQQQNEFYGKFHFTSQYQWDSLDAVLYPNANRTVTTKKPTGCTLNKRVFGWLPYWTTSTEENNLNLSLLSDVAYFSYEVDVSTGGATSTHSWTTDACVTKALSSGVKVSLTATLMSSHATFFGSTTSENNFITTIINLVKARGATGVNIDFEAVPSSLSASLTSFMQRLCDSVHTRIAGGQVTVAAPAVNWSGTWNVSALKAYVDMWVIMGYDYWYGGSPTAGPCSPLTGGGMWGSYDCTNSVIYYLSQGVPNSKVALGVPYYGYDYPCSSAALNASTTGSGTATLYKNTSANAVTYGRLWDNYSMDPHYTYGSYHQCFYDDGISLGYKYDMVNIQNIGGIGIWALGYDDGYSTAWTAIQDHFTSCTNVPCSGEFRDLGDTDTGNYYNNENWTWALTPTGATAVSMTFSSFNTTTGDILSIYNGPTTASPLIGTYQSTTSPGTVTGTSGSLTFHFSSSASGATASGWKAQWLCSGPGSCGPPIGLNATTITTNSATLNWAAVSGATSYNVQYKASAASTWTTTSTSSTSLPISGLSSSTSYEFQVQAVCSATGNYSSPVTFSTTCIMNYASLPYNTSFENTWMTDSCDGGAQRVPDSFWKSSIGGTSPTGDDYWHRNDYTGADWTIPATGAYTPGSSNGTYSARFHNDPPPAGSTGVLDLYIDLSPVGTKTISFDYIHNEVSPSPFAFNVELSTDGGTSFTTLLTITSAQMSAWTTQTVTTTASSATSVIRFIVTDKGTSDVGIDNLKITNGPSGIQSLTNSTSNLNVYPNPFNKNFTVEYSLLKAEPVKIDIIDMLGRTISLYSSANEASGEHKMNIDFNSLGLAKGVYVLQLQTENGVSFFKLIAE